VDDERIVVGEAEEAQAAVIDYWHTVELFSPQRVDPVSHVNQVFRVEDRKPLPWERGHPIMARRLRPDLVWRHTVYLGIYELDDVLDVLEQVFPTPPEAYDERRPGESALAALEVSHDGRPLFGSETLSSCAWATGRALRIGPRAPAWLSGLDRDELRLRELCEEMFAIDEDDDLPSRLGPDDSPVGRPLTSEDVRACRDAVVKIIGLADVSPPSRATVRRSRAAPAGERRELVSQEIRIKSQIIGRKRAYRGDDSDFLNSFIADDLQRVADAVRKGRSAAALGDYLRPLDQGTPTRVDVENGGPGLRAVYEAVAPERVPLGRWPADIDHPLALGQQFAVNQILSSLSGAQGVFGVNGPPGTGKTTMLRDLVAALIVARAERLAALQHPAHAFTTSVEYRTGDHERQVPRLQDTLTGYEVVVASSNNAAVENVTTEIPGAEAIASAWDAEVRAIDHHRGIATAVLNANDLDGDPESWDPAWALIAAPLGNRRNCRRFASAFWWGDEGDPKRGTPARSAMRQLIDECASRPPSPGDWRAAVDAFRAAHRRAQALQSARADAARAVAALVPARSEVDRLTDATAAAHARADAARAELTTRQASLPALEEKLDRARARQLHHRQSEHPSVLATLISLGRELTRWREVHAPLAEDTRQADRALEAAHDEATLSAAALAAADRATSEALRELDGAQQHLAALIEAVERARPLLGGSLPDDTWWAADQRQRRELRAPWTDPEWNAARTQLLLAALALHKAFVRQTAARLRPGLQTAIDIMSGRASPDLSEDAARAAWQTLFLVVPVVSTTFSSVGRLFSHLGPESLGWLLVDEAGQATPQSAVGAIWRSRRMVAVGDPLQLEPIVTLPFTAQDAIRTQHGVPSSWLPSHTSVQQLADRLTPVGTSLPGTDPQHPVWVGAPLKVHRRCDEPMFSIVNDLVYDGLMIYATRRGTEPSVYDNLPASAWYDVVGGESTGHWIPAEGAQLQRLLDGIASQGIDLGDVMAIAPFRDVAREIDRLARSKEAYRNLLGGTIHRAQGREADIVILVLGGDPSRPGAKAWAASKPNLVNVAVSRARRRIYVVGNREEWREQNYFGTVAERLRVKGGGT
jgi:hypothetical protein